MRLVDGQAQRAAIELPGRGMHDDRVRRRLARRLDQPDLRDGVHRDVGERVALAAHVAGLRGEIEDHVGTFAERAHIDVADIGAHEFDRDAVEVRRIGAAAEQEAVERGHARAALRQRLA